MWVRIAEKAFKVTSQRSKIKVMTNQLTYNGGCIHCDDVASRLTCFFSSEIARHCNDCITQSVIPWALNTPECVYDRSSFFNLAGESLTESRRPPGWIYMGAASHR